MRAFILSYFDALLGPAVLLMDPATITDQYIEEIPDLMNLHESGFFIHSFKQYQSANMKFKIPSVADRGGEITFLASILVSNAKLNMNHARHVLQDFVHEVSEIEDAWRAIPKRGFTIDKSKQEHILSVIKATQNSMFKILDELEQIINLSPVTVFSWRSEKGWPVEYVSENVNRFGFDPDDFYLGKVSFPEIVHPDDRRKIQQEINRINHDPESAEFTMEYRIIKKDGSVCWVDDRTIIRRDARGRITHHQGILLDITSKKEMQRLLRQRDNELMELKGYEKGIETCNRLTLDTAQQILLEAVKSLSEASSASRVFVAENISGPESKLYASQAIQMVHPGSEEKYNGLVFQMLDYSDGFERWREMLSQGRIIRAMVKDLPESERKAFEGRDVASILLIPLVYKNKWYGFIGFERNGKSKGFTDDEVMVLDVMADLVRYYIRKYKAKA